MSPIYKRYLCLLGALCCALSGQASAGKSKPKLEVTPLMHIVADSSQYNYRARETWFEGHVQIDQGETHLLADRLITKKNNQNKIQEALAFGLQEPAHYWTIRKKGDKPLHAYAKLMKLYPLESRIVLEGDVLVTEGENRFQGQIIVYNVKLQTITVPPTKNSRATFVIDAKTLKQTI